MHPRHVLERGDERGHVATQLDDHLAVGLDDLAHQLERGQQDGVVARAEQRANALGEGVDELGAPVGAHSARKSSS